MRRLRGVLGFGRIETIVRAKPRGKRGRGRVRRPQLTEGNAYGGARKSIVADYDCGGLAAGHDRIDNVLLERKPLRIAVALEQNLESHMALRLKGPVQAERVPRRMRRIKMRARNPTGWQRLVRRVRTAIRQQFGKHMGMRPGRALAAGRRDRLVNLDATEPADKDDADWPPG